MSCDCIHDPEVHDPATGACLYTNPIFGPCPCAGTSDQTRKALEAAHRQSRTATGEPPTAENKSYMKACLAAAERAELSMLRGEVEYLNDRIEADERLVALTKEECNDHLVAMQARQQQTSALNAALLEACKAAELAIDLAGSACADTETDKRCGECTGCLLYAALTMSRAAIKGHS